MAGSAKHRICPITVFVLLLIVAAAAWKFIVSGSTRPGEDGRVVVVLEPGERAFVLREMRAFVGNLQAIADGLARDDMTAVANAGRAAGAGKAHDAPVALLAKLPLEFKTKAFATHGAFDAIAVDAQKGASAKQLLGQFAGVTQQCVACHAAYRFD